MLFFRPNPPLYQPPNFLRSQNEVMRQYDKELAKSFHHEIRRTVRAAQEEEGYLRDHGGKYNGSKLSAGAQCKLMLEYQRMRQFEDQEAQARVQHSAPPTLPEGVPYT
eukprot:gene21676-1235_t